MARHDRHGGAGLVSPPHAIYTGRSPAAGVAHDRFQMDRKLGLRTRDAVAKRTDGMRLRSCTLAGAGNSDVRLQACMYMDIDGGETERACTPIPCVLAGVSCTLAGAGNGDVCLQVCMCMDICGGGTERACSPIPCMLAGALCHTL
jgi:hypothetical protein